MKSILLFVLMSFSLSSNAAKPQITVHGILKSYDKEVITIQTTGGQIKVPRKSAKVPLDGLQVGKATLQAKVSAEDMIRLNGSPTKTKKK